jgi:hypothetical protein
MYSPRTRLERTLLARCAAASAIGEMASTRRRPKASLHAPWNPGLVWVVAAVLGGTAACSLDTEPPPTTEEAVAAVLSCTKVSVAHPVTTDPVGGVNGGTAPTQSSYVSYQQGGNEAAYAFDSSLSTRWGTSGQTAGPIYIYADLGSAKTFNQVVFTWYANGNNRSPKTFDIDYCSGSLSTCVTNKAATANGTNGWTTAWSGSGTVSGTQTQTVNFAASVKSQYIRIIDPSGGSNGPAFTVSADDITINNCGTTCTPTTCAALGDTCGTPPDGCGGVLNCGTCTWPQACGGTTTYSCGSPSLAGGINYDTACFNANVPMPPDLDSPLWKAVPATAKNTTTIDGMAHGNVLTAAQSFTIPPGTFGRAIFYFESTGTSNTPDSPLNGVNSANPKGVCALNAPIDSGGDFFQNLEEINVICQGANPPPGGTTPQACFWRWPGSPALSFNINQPSYFCNAPNTEPGVSGQMELIDGVACSGQTAGLNPRIASRRSSDFAGNGTFSPNLISSPQCNANGSWGNWQGTGLGCQRLFVGGYDEIDNQALAGDQALTVISCTGCHAGENMFINHPGTATDFAQYLTNISNYFPTIANSSYWPNPIVPAYQGQNGEALFPTVNPAPITDTGYSPSVCSSCHTTPTAAACQGTSGVCGGRFPAMSRQLANFNGNPTGSGADTGGYCPTVFQTATTRTPGTPPMGEMPPGLGNSATSDAFANTMLTTNCNQWGNLADWNSPVIDTGGTANYGGLGYRYPQGPTLNSGVYESVYGNVLKYSTVAAGGYTELESTANYFCWATGFYVAQDDNGIQPNPLPNMHLDVANYSDGPHWRLAGSNPGNNSINAQCVPWEVIFESSLTNQNSRNWSASQAMATRVENTYGTGLQNVTGSNASSVCFISGIDGQFMMYGDSNQAAMTLWWPGETSPNTYTGNGTQWQVQLSNSPTQAFYNTHITCIDIGMDQPYNTKFTSGGINGFNSQFCETPYTMEPIDSNACFYTQIVGFGTPFDDLFTGQNGDGNLLGSNWSIGNDGCGSSVVWQFQDCLSFK